MKQELDGAQLANDVFRVYTAPGRITQRRQTAKETCGRSGETWTTDERVTPHCKRD